MERKESEHSINPRGKEAKGKSRYIRMDVCVLVCVLVHKTQEYRSFVHSMHKNTLFSYYITVCDEKQAFFMNLSVKFLKKLSPRM